MKYAVLLSKKQSMFLRDDVSAYKTLFASFLLPVACRRAHVLFTLFVLVCVYTLFIVYVLIINVSCPPGALIWKIKYRVSCIVVYNTLSCVFAYDFLRLVYPMLPVSLDCPFLIDTTVLSNVYLFLVSKIRSLTCFPLLICRNL